MKTSTILMLLGGFFALGGILALANPFAASLAVASLTGVVFLIGGVLQLWFAFRDAAQPHRLWNGIVGLMGVLAGVFLLANPLGGLVSLTILLAILFLVTGIARIIGAFALKGSPLFWLLLLSGAASAVLGVLILIWLPEAASSLLGLLLGIELIAEGAALIALGLKARNTP
ncbi:DUF308 domain-containing protein [Xinfangfangia sp. CPCC 101601]|uniref:DUF308 domain-containing protein n=1 Tax=Pseudogemmobacter lacusdianii TaxID=3069608 RepID=A0ABU0VYX3_9RHOB|nr:DUF308 domain-containing protein [Xinfangfangia sp. CPCC 101601]MDQ2066848.1 DUF308 domain-containing protein [Xinfangfangia sp. CPCC 101601]